MKDYNIKKWPINCVNLIKIIENRGKINLMAISSTALKNHEDAKTIYIPELDKYLIAVNREKVHYPFKSSKDRRLNFTLAHELAHIFLKHSDLPDECKDDFERELEELEANEFAGRLLMPKQKILSCNFASLSKVAKYFNVSESAILKRLSNLNSEYLRFSQPTLIHENLEYKKISAVSLNTCYYTKCDSPTNLGSGSLTPALEVIRKPFLSEMNYLTRYNKNLFTTLLKHPSLKHYIKAFVEYISNILIKILIFISCATIIGSCINI